MQLGPEEVLLNVEVRFTPDQPVEAVRASIHRIGDRIRAPIRR